MSIIEGRKGFEPLRSSMLPVVLVWHGQATLEGCICPDNSGIVSRVGENVEIFFAILFDTPTFLVSTEHMLEV